MPRNYKKPSLNSPSILKLYRTYKSYVVESIQNREHILTLEQYYYKQREQKDISKSMTFEYYLKDMRLKESINEI